MRGESGNPRNYIFYSLSHNVRAQSIISSIIQEYAYSGFHQSYALEAYFLLLFSTLVRSNEYSFYGIDKKTMEIIQFIRENCCRHTLGNIAEMLGYHPNYLTTYVKKHTGRNCRDIIQETKLQYAIELLDNSVLSIYHIAEECGYSSPSHFFRVFREKYGITPNEYRVNKV